MSIRKSDPTKILLSRQPLVGKKDSLHFFVEGDHGKVFHGSTFFPNALEDFLLYLTIAGSVSKPGLRMHNSLNRVSVMKLSDSMNRHNNGLPASMNNRSPNSSVHEAIVCVAFWMACNAGSINGCSLEELLQRFVAELICPLKTDYTELKIVDKIPFRGGFQSKFALPYEASLPFSVQEIWKTVQCSRPDNREGIDAVTYVPLSNDQKCYEIIVEAKSTINPAYVRETIQKALTRQDSNAKVSFIVVDKDPLTVPEYDLKEFSVVVRDEISANEKLPQGPVSDARMFYVDIETAGESNQIVLLPMDGEESLDLVASRVIFVISIARINRRF
jgi:hypothetical protein